MRLVLDPRKRALLTALRARPHLAQQLGGKVKAGWTLEPGPQTEAAESEAFETLFGGQAGGGKTELIAWLALNQHHSSLVLRRSFPELGRTLIPRMLEKYPDPRRYNQSDHTWRFEDGKRIELSYLDNLKDVFKFQGAEIDGFFPDELTQYPRDWYLYLFSRIRSTRAGQRKRCLATTNPGGEGEMWVKQRWAAWLDRKHPNPAKSGELRWYRRLQSEADYAEEEVPEEVGRNDPMAWSRTFIRAKMIRFISDDYRRNLDMQPEPWRSQLKDGNWEIGEKDADWQVIPTAWAVAAQERWPTRERPAGPIEVYGCDPARGGTDHTVIGGRIGNWFAEQKSWPGTQTPDGQSVVMHMATVPDGATARWRIDVIGVGSSAVDIARQNNFDVEAVNGSERSEAKDKSGRIGFVNERAAEWWQMREALDPVSGEDLALPPDPELLADLTAPRWKMMANGIQIEPKDCGKPVASDRSCCVKHRLGRSPDKGDTAVYTLGQRAGKGAGFLEYIATQKAKRSAA